MSRMPPLTHSQEGVQRIQTVDTVVIAQARNSAYNIANIIAITMNAAWAMPVRAN